MAKGEPKPLSGRGGTGYLSDAVHGRIDLSDPVPGEGAIARIIHSRFFDRLRRIKQLGFSSQNYLTAHHTRFGHSVGTMQMMRRLVSRLREKSALTKSWRALAQMFPESFSCDLAYADVQLEQHLLVAALLQDGGGLPYSQATGHVFQPSRNLTDFVVSKLANKLPSPSAEQVWILAALHRSESDGGVADLLGEIDRTFVAFLLTGHAPILPTADALDVLLLRHIVDGVVDADRLDYVARDTFHTIGAMVRPTEVIDTLLRYELRGPVFASVEPVRQFLRTRDNLRDTVFLEPAARLRVLLLVGLLREILSGTDRRIVVAFWGEDSRGDLTFEEFLELDDISIFSRLRTFAATSASRRLSHRGRIALDILLGGSHPYTVTVLQPPSRPASGEMPVTIPPDLFWDTYSDQTPSGTGWEHVYVEEELFITGEKRITPLVPSGIQRLGVADRYGEGRIAVYAPANRDGLAWKSIAKANETQTLWATLIEQDVLVLNAFPPDTWHDGSFRGPKLFVSFCWDDVATVKCIVRGLYDRRQRYRLLIRPFQGLGDTPAKNSADGVLKSEGVLILVSDNYVARYRDRPDGNIHHEITAMTTRRAKEPAFPIVALSMAGHHGLSGLPWSEMGFSEPPFVGEPLASLNEQALAELATEVCSAIETSRRPVLKPKEHRWKRSGTSARRD